MCGTRGVALGVCVGNMQQSEHASMLGFQVIVQRAVITCAIDFVFGGYILCWGALSSGPSRHYRRVLI